MEHIDFHISYKCFNKCVFCSSSGAIDKFKNHPLKFEKILNALNKKSGKFKSVNFSGGEPTLCPFFPKLLKATKNLGYRIYIGSGGEKFSDKKFCGETAPYINEISFSLHGHKAALHNFHTKNKKSFKKIIKAIKNFKNFPVRLSTNTVVTKYNINYLKDILKFIIGLKQIDQVLISNLAPEGRASKNYDKLVANLNIFKKIAPTLIEIADKNNSIIKFFGFPACIFGKYAVYSNDFVWDERLNIEQNQNKTKFFLQEDKGFLPTRSRVKTKKCQSCFYKNICGGLFEEYYKRFGDKELEPIKK